MSELRQLDQGLLDKAIAAALCGDGDHKWKFIGCAGCSCDDIGGCSLPVHECENCGDCDYADNEESAEIRAKCAAGQP